MFIREREVKGRTDVNYYTARRLGDMAESLNQLARAFDDGIEKNGQLTKDDGLAAMQASAAWCARTAAGVICMRTARRRTAITSIIFCGHLSRRVILILRTCPRCSRAAAGRRRIILPN